MQHKIKLNKDKGKKLIALLKTIPEDKFDMSIYRTGPEDTHKCESTGCIVGWATALDNFPNLSYFEDPWSGNINFSAWSLDFFFNVVEDPKADDMPNLWNFLFSSLHAKSNPFYNPEHWHGPTTEHAIARIQYILDDKELPLNWRRELRNGNLFYMPKTTAQ